MSAYLGPLRTAVIAFPFIAALIVLPVYIYQYRKFGFVNKLRLATIYAFVLYMICAYFLVILPLPSTRDIISLLGTNRQTYDLVPFSSIHDIINETQVMWSNPHTYIHLLKERAFLQVAFNFLLTVPFGVFMRYLFNRKLGQTILFTFCLTLFFEISQLTGLFWIYNAPYRLFSVDDLIQNTCGGILGYIVTPIITWFIPSLEDVDRKKERKINSVGTIRRLVAMAIDLFVVDFITGILSSVTMMQSLQWVFFIAILILYFITFAYITQGFTIGKWLLRLRLANDDGRLYLWPLIVRETTFFGAVWGMNRLFTFLLNSVQNHPIIMLGLFLIAALYNVILVINFLWNIRSREFFHDRLSGVTDIAVAPHRSSYNATKE
ncbi:permease [Alloscardovia theropitheci]|uniref:Permease n=1 Tax=Alloscardovia theropitheci TaxID=2496842 RepID=A0A4R0R1L8_9BIFI|nr:VanZ family protein [Alloscardovia theropitheci]TCD55046.1 permease [Alloscardovia theropitheci]